MPTRARITTSEPFYGISRARIGATAPTAVGLVTTGLAGRYDATAITPVADGTQLALWSDSTANLNDVSAASTLKPLYKTSIFSAGVPSVRFDGINDVMNATSNSALSLQSTWTVALTFQLLAIPGSDAFVVMCLQGGNSNYALVVKNVAGAAKVAAGMTTGAGYKETTTTTTVAINTKHLLLATYNGTTISTRLDRASEGTIAAGATSATVPNNFLLGTGANIDFGELLIYNRLLSVIEIGQAETYLRGKWSTV